MKSAASVASTATIGTSAAIIAGTRGQVSGAERRSAPMRAATPSCALITLASEPTPAARKTTRRGMVPPAATTQPCHASLRVTSEDRCSKAASESTQIGAASSAAPNCEPRPASTKASKPTVTSVPSTVNRRRRRVGAREATMQTSCGGSASLAPRAAAGIGRSPFLAARTAGPTNALPIASLQGTPRKGAARHSSWNCMRASRGHCDRSRARPGRVFKDRIGFKRSPTRRSTSVRLPTMPEIRTRVGAREMACKTPSFTPNGVRFGARWPKARYS